jgi:hypothetical protein
VSDEAETRVRPEQVLAVRLGHGANCSSVGSIVDTLFLGAAVGGAVFAAVCAALGGEAIRIVGEDGSEHEHEHEHEHEGQP